jgi:hypothetical protein
LSLFEAEVWHDYVGSAVIDSVVLAVAFGKAGTVILARTYLT